ncbi:hypothetical protein X926_09620 [Petrotoga sp. HWHPT.55.6.3]|nr:hypothetical protein X926_09620 [Petrotoga sp. HWHPT.55.6.3]
MGGERGKKEQIFFLMVKKLGKGANKNPFPYG